MGKNYNFRLDLAYQRKKKHPCNLCEYVGTGRGELKRHIQMVHLGKKFKGRCKLYDAIVLLHRPYFSAFTNITYI